MQHERIPGDDQSPPEECPSCPSCQGTAAGTGAKIEARLLALEKQSDVIATLTLGATWNLPFREARTVTYMIGLVADPPFIRANREALRWHCALLV